MFKVGQLLLALTFGCGATLAALNGMGQRAENNSRQGHGAASTATISLTPCEVPGATEGSKEKVLCGTFAVYEDRERRINANTGSPVAGFRRFLVLDGP